MPVDRLDLWQFILTQLLGLKQENNYTRGPKDSNILIRNSLKVKTNSFQPLVLMLRSNLFLLIHCFQTSRNNLKNIILFGHRAITNISILRMLHPLLTDDLTHWFHVDVKQEFCETPHWPPSTPSGSDPGRRMKTLYYFSSPTYNFLNWSRKIPQSAILKATNRSRKARMDA